MKQKLIVLTVIAMLAGCSAMRTASIPDSDCITMTIDPRHEVILYIAGTGKAVIDWGNGGDKEVIELREMPDNGYNMFYRERFKFSKRYPSLYSGTVTITEKITAIFTRGSKDIVTIDASRMPGLLWLICDDEKLTALNVSGCAGLERLQCAFNALTELDVRHNAALNYLACDYNKLKSIDLSNNAALIDLWCSGNQLSALDVSANTALKWFFCNDNLLTELDITQNAELIQLHCEDNKLTALDISNNAMLGNLHNNGNRMERKALLHIINALPKNDDKEMNDLFLGGNPGYDTLTDEDKATATAKGWKVLDYYESDDEWHADDVD